MRILFLSYYFQPDLCAGSFRNTALLEALKAQLPPDSQVDVITTMPTRYSSFAVDALPCEMMRGVTIHRIALPNHKSGMIDQSIAFKTFAMQALKISRKQNYDLIYASSSRLMTAILGSVIARQKDLPLYLDIRDIFVDTMNDVLPRKLTWFANPILSLMERWSLSRAQKINLVSAGFFDYFKSRYPAIDYSFFTNGIDEEFLTSKEAPFEKNNSKLPEVVYAGNFGEGQGLHHIIPQLAKHFEGMLHFTLIGDGGRKAQLEDSLNEHNISNVTLKVPMNRKELLLVYQQADILFMHLNAYDAFLKVLPSKIFEYAAMGKPIWAGVSGYSSQFLQEHVENAAIFMPCDLASAISSFGDLELEVTPRVSFQRKFARSAIMKEMAKDILNCIGRHKS